MLYKTYLVAMGSAAWLGPNLPSQPLPFMPVRPLGFLHIETQRIQHQLDCNNHIIQIMHNHKWIHTRWRLIIIILSNTSGDMRGGGGSYPENLIREQTDQHYIQWMNRQWETSIYRQNVKIIIIIIIIITLAHFKAEQVPNGITHGYIRAQHVSLKR